MRLELLKSLIPSLITFNVNVHIQHNSITYISG